MEAPKNLHELLGVDGKFSTPGEAALTKELAEARQTNRAMLSVMDEINAELKQAKARIAELEANPAEAHDIDMERWAESEHVCWSNWMSYMFGKGSMNLDGSWTMPKWAVERWTRQALAVYADLSELEKQSDRDVVVKYHGGEISALRARIIELAKLEDSADCELYAHFLHDSCGALNYQEYLEGRLTWALTEVMKLEGALARVNPVEWKFGGKDHTEKECWCVLCEGSIRNGVGHTSDCLWVQVKEFGK